MNPYIEQVLYIVGGQVNLIIALMAVSLALTLADWFIDKIRGIDGRD